MTTKLRAGGFAAVLSAAAMALTLGLSAAPANAAIGNVSAKLTITPYSPGYHNTAVFGYVKMTRTEAQGLINSGHSIKMKLWGDDPVWDDSLMGPYTATYYASDRGLEFHKVILHVDDDILDEDWGMDELYVNVKLQGPTGGTVRSGNTNTWYGFF